MNNLRIRIGRLSYFILAILFTLCILAQIYLAGMAVFMSPVNWAKHIMFVHLFGFNLPVLMLIFAFVGALPRWAYWHLFGFLVSIFLMYFTANIRAVIPWVGPMHAVFACILFVLSSITVLKTWKIIFNKRKRD